MRIPVAVAVLMIVFASCSRGNRESGRQTVLPTPGPHRENDTEIALPKPGLLRTCPSKRPQLWPDSRTAAKIYPVKFYIDLAEGGCSYGFVAWYDKSVSWEEVRTAINQLYARWEETDLVKPGSISIWRVKSEKFVIQLTHVGENATGQDIAEPGMTQVIYLPMTDRHVNFSENIEDLSREYRTAFKSLCDCR